MARAQQAARRGPFSRVPSLDNSAAHRFPQAWAQLSTHARVLHSVALEAGLSVVHHESVWLWSGNVDAFKASGLFKPSQNWSFVSKLSEATTGEGLRATFIRLPEEPEYIGAVVTINPPGARSVGRLAGMAAADAGYQSFRAVALSPVALDDGDAGQEPDAAARG